MRTSHGGYAPDADEYAAMQSGWRQSLAGDEELRAVVVVLQVSAERHSFTYQWERAGVPIVRLPDDIVVLQELLWSYRLQCVVDVVETGLRGAAACSSTRA